MEADILVSYHYIQLESKLIQIFLCMPDRHKVFSILNIYPILMLGYIVNGNVKVSHGNHNFFPIMIIRWELMNFFV